MKDVPKQPQADDRLWMILFLCVTPAAVALAAFAAYVLRPTTPMHLVKQAEAQLAECKAQKTQAEQRAEEAEKKFAALRTMNQRLRAQLSEAPQRPPTPQDATAEVSYTTLRQWQPNSEPHGLGLDILLHGRVTKERVIDLAKRLSRGRDPVLVRGFLTRAAYDEEQADTLTPEYDRGYLFFYVKNTTGRGAYRGFNEIRWMQAEGEFSHLFGQNTKF